MSAPFLGHPSSPANAQGQDDNRLPDLKDRGPIRAQLLGLERLEERARRLARSCELAPLKRVSSPLLQRFVENQRILVRAERRIMGQEIHGIDADWLADNFHIVDEVLREVRLDLPRGYDAVLPKLANTELAGYPRVYAIAVVLVAHTDSELDEQRITRFVKAFQEVAPLTIGELWALPTMCRLILLENLRRLAEQMLWGWDERQRAEQWCRGKFGEAAGPAAFGHSKAPSGASASSAMLPDGPLSDPLVVRLVQCLRDEGPAAAFVVDRLEAKLAETGQDVDRVLAREHHRQAVNQVTVGNCVLGLRLLSAVDWNKFFEQSSIVEKILREDPAGAYPLQDFPTSDRYRKAVEKVARESRADELDVARKAVEMAGAASGQDVGARGHVGYYLVGKGESELRRHFDARAELRDRVLQAALAHPKAVYFGAAALLMAASLWLIARSALAGTSSHVGLWLAVVLAMAFLPVSEFAVGLVNHLLTLLLPPRVLSKLEFKDGIPEEFTTFVVMPSMLVKPSSAAGLLERLETHYLANPNARVRFALLTDFADAPREVMPTDEALVRDAIEQVRALNRRYAEGGPDLFYLFHRKRLWNEAQGCWMGWERKRGKLSEFNRLLRGDRDTTYTAWSADPSTLPTPRFIVTLDADTQMPRDTVGRLIGTLAHPLNQPRFDAASGRVVEGYGVLQPRVSFHMTAATHSRFASLLAASGGIDPYSTAASDAYMDLFGLGSFTGKGIYDLNAFEAATGETFPENHILSHDLIEGNYARCGLLSDTELFDDFPARYHAYARREHRWVRGDWQLLPWLGRTVPALHGDRPNPLPLVERWKLLDNLRRSLVPPALIVMLALGWTVAPGSPWLWTIVALVVLALPLLKWIIGVSLNSARSGKLTPFKSWRESIPSMGGQAILSAITLADQAASMCDAIGRTLWRLLVSRRRLLEWETAASTDQRLGTGFLDFLRGMKAAPLTAVVIGLAVLLIRPGAFWAAAPLLLAWLVSPLVAYGISLPKPIHDLKLADDERRALRRMARKTWSFFETFVGDEDHWLPPDNFQEFPDGRVAHRTSPTNKGLLLLSTLSAHDLGYLSLARMVERLEKTFDTLGKLETHWGHFYNWYDTRTLQGLPPAYISTVDSGNFLGCLVGLRQGLKEKLRAKMFGPFVIDGLADTFRLLDEAKPRMAPRIQQLLDAQPDTFSAWADWLSRMEREADDLIRRLRTTASKSESPGEADRWAEALHAMITERQAEVAGLIADNKAADHHDASVPPELAARINRLIGLAESMGAAMDFRPLYKTERHLYAIGANLSQDQLDGACYDLLASESCLTSYLTVARGDAPRRHWFHLGRPFIWEAGRTGLISWGGTMFEYLMPRLLLRSLPKTLLSEACETAVARQIEYGRQLGIPWGVSESAFSAQYREGDYRYQSFGVPGLGLKRGLEKDRVVAPYATVMATMIAPREALANFRRLASEGAEGPYGFYEAVDYTPDRLAQNQHAAVVKSYMAHHQGMGLVALNNVINDNPMPRRFHSDPMVRAAELLLQERIPPDTPYVEARHAGHEMAADAAAGEGGAGASTASLLSRRLTSPFTVAPRTHLLSNTHYHVMVTNAGSGSSTCWGLDMTRWRQDSIAETHGNFVYIRDVESGAVWSAGHQPVCAPADGYEVVFSSDKAVFRRRDRDIETLLEVTVSPEQPAEVRRVTITNLDPRKTREIEVTSYLEPVLAPHASDRSHPAYAKLFLETEQIEASDALVCRRRPRSADEKVIWGVHAMAVDRTAPGCTLVGGLQFETDRSRFIGRGRTLADPAALEPNAVLSGTTGPVLDPALSLRRKFSLSPGGSAVVGYTLAIAETRDAALVLADKYHGISAVARAFELAWAHCQVEHGHGSSAPEESHLYQRLGSQLLFPGSALRAHPEASTLGARGLGTLWKFGISGDRPIVLVRIAEVSELSLIRQLLAAHEFLRTRGVEIDLVVLDEERASEGENLNEQIQAVVRGSGAENLMNRPGGLFVLQGEVVNDGERPVLESAARMILDGARGPLAGQLDRIEATRTLPEPFQPSQPPGRWDDQAVALPAGLQFFNGTGGFTPDGRAYCMLIAPEGQGAETATANDGQLSQASGRYPSLPPAPWINVIANPNLGFLVSETGAGFTWAGNSQTNRLTAWSNDPVIDPPSEVIYLRDEATGQCWCPTPLPIPSQEPTLVTHAFGFSVFQRHSHGLAHELTLFVPTESPVKLLRLRLHNPGDQPRRLSATYYAEWVLGANRETTSTHLITEIDPDTGALIARNPFRQDYDDRLAFADVNLRPRTVTADRGEFLGRHGSLASPAALSRVGLSGRAGTGFDPCAAIQAAFSLDPGETKDVVFMMGEAESLDRVRALIDQFRDLGRLTRTMEDVGRNWAALLQSVQVRTPDRSFDLLLNGWLLYQVLACRLWARSAFYQSGGAFGFRDQLQDVMALLHADPGIARDQILLAASRQFVEGDVQHWWHPPMGRGVRTTISDDLLWLPYVTSAYVKVTGDSSILDVQAPSLQAPTLQPGEHDAFGVPAVTEEKITLYKHCLRAIERGFRLSDRGLPLIQGGDWNDGMNRVGAEGRGESIWLAWFLVDCLRNFAPIAASRGDEALAHRYLERSEALVRAVEALAWDGDWYLRAFYDDGAPMGSHSSEDCQIDSIAQSWGVISGGANPERARRAMQSVQERLVHLSDGVILLLTPPFDAGSHNPGYIKGYVPGIRENGAQYTHAATWVVQATALLGDGQSAYGQFHAINPINHARNRSEVDRYKIEPYVVAGDVYGYPPHTGRGGWSWYTGAAGWLYRIGLEVILGIHREGYTLAFKPVIPPDWQGFEVLYRFQGSAYRIHVENPNGSRGEVIEVFLDGQKQADGTIALIDDGQDHHVRIVMQPS